MSWLQRLKGGLTRTKDAIVNKVAMTVRRAVAVNDEFWEQIEEILILGDVGMNTAVAMVEEMRQRYRQNKPRDMEELLGMISQVMAGKLQPGDQRDPLAFEPGLNVIMLIGVNGSGKTTTTGKLANYFSAQGKKVMLAACDTFRAAAVEQLEIWANRADVPIVRHQAGTDPAAVMFDAVESARARNVDILLADTAGRLHTKHNLMEELKKLQRVAVEKGGAASFRSWLVLDATLGQNSLNQVKLFNESVPVDALVITKLDGTAKGGIVFAIQSEIKVPIAFIGVGEKLEDMMPFRAAEFSQALIGDVSSDNVTETSEEIAEEQQAQ